MSHLSDSLHTMDSTNQVLYNRVLVQIGLAAFRLGLLSECVNILGELCCSPKIKVLLGQGLTRGVVDKEERRRFYPLHMHISLEVLDSVFLISALLVDTPTLLSETDRRNQSLSLKKLRAFIDSTERNYFISSPEQSRDYIYAAYKELVKGRWRTVYATLLQINLWKTISNPEKVKKVLLSRVKESACRCFIINYGIALDTVDFDYLTRTLEFTPEELRSLISRIALFENQNVSLTEEPAGISIQKKEGSTLQRLAFTLSEKATQLVHHNEKLLDSKVGSYGFSEKELQETQTRGGKPKPKSGGPRNLAQQTRKKYANPGRGKTTR
eukprot:TRINITY_DN947_c0_g1_i6.p1 TRINITY_DN947_c0_g1~~TRINITY_DN947_c0_g1_i6.p1  ORF type:complete len:326 (+),score=92.42 TRINITY_DN947_c0_g1_i6:325-1302(+)